jgi:hypothetical protein
MECIDDSTQSHRQNLFAAQITAAQIWQSLLLAPDAEFTASSMKDDFLDTGVTWTVAGCITFGESSRSVANMEKVHTLSWQLC